MVIYHFWKFHVVLGRGLKPSPENVAHNLRSLAHSFLKIFTVASMACCLSNWKATATCMACYGSGWGSRSAKWQVVLGLKHLEVLVASLRVCSSRGRLFWLGFFGSTSLIVLGELNQIILSSHHMFTLADRLTWVIIGGGCYNNSIVYIVERV